MKGLIDKVGESFKKTYEQVIDQTQKTVDQTKQRTDLIKLKNELKKLYEITGKEAYESHIEEKEYVMTESLASRITKTKRQIEALEKELDETVEYQKESFKSYTGHVKSTWEEQTQKNTTEYTEEGIQVLKFCPKCNIGNNVDALYCKHCGQKL